MRVYFDTEFTGLHQNTTLISIGCVAENGRTFYAELTDYDKRQVDKWIRDNVIANLRYNGHPTDHDGCIIKGSDLVVVGDRQTVALRMEEWLESFGETVEMWSDCLAYDWVLFCQLFGGAFSVPLCVHYIPFDLCTLMKLKDVDPNFSREAIAGVDAHGEANKHNALHDARIIKTCVEQIECLTDLNISSYEKADNRKGEN